MARYGRDGNAGGVEHGAVGRDPGAVDVARCAARILPDHEVVLTVERDRRVILTVGCQRDRDSTRIQHGAVRSQPGSVDVVGGHTPMVLPDREEVRAVESYRWLGLPAD